MIREEDIREVRERTDIVEVVGERVTLRRKGRLFWGLCPFHQEKTPSFKVDPEVGLYHCFGCGEGGDVFGFMMKTEGLDFVDAVRLLAERAHFELTETVRTGPGQGGPSRMRLLDAHRVAQRFYAEQLMRAEEARLARDYLAGRGFHSEAARLFGLGWAPGGDSLVGELTRAGFSEAELLSSGLAVRSEAGHLGDRFRRRAMFPIRDTAGRVIAFGGRVLDDGQPKYLNSADSPIFRKSKVLYALDAAKQAITEEGSVAVVEGYTDAIAAHVAGLTNVVATLGTALTEEHLRVLARFARRVVLVFDADEAGLAAAERSLAFAGRYGVPGAGLIARVVDEGKLDVRVAVLPEGSDPADLLGRDPEAFRTTLAEAEPLVDFVLERRIAGRDLSAVSGRLDAAREALAVLADVESPVARREYLELVASRLQLEAHVLEAESRRMAGAGAGRARAAKEATGEPTTAGMPQPPTPETLVERQALTALIHSPELAAEWGDVLREELFSDPDARAVWRELSGAGAPSAEELARRLSDRPAAAASLAGVLLGEEEAARLAGEFSDIVRRLKEFSLGRQIDEAKARLMSAERSGGPIDELQAELWELQRAQHEWRLWPERGSDEQRSDGTTTED